MRQSRQCSDVSPPVVPSDCDPTHQLQQSQRQTNMIRRQRGAYNRLHVEVQAAKQQRDLLSSTVESLRLRLNTLLSKEEQCCRLRRENQRLRAECDKLESQPNGLPINGLRGMDERGDYVCEGPHWPCGSCTFLNHPAITVCEQCEMPRISYI